RSDRAVRSRRELQQHAAPADRGRIARTGEGADQERARPAERDHCRPRRQGSREQDLLRRRHQGRQDRRAGLQVVGAPDYAARMAFEVRAATEAERPDVAQLIREMIPGVAADARLHWLYENNPAGRALTW